MISDKKNNINFSAIKLVIWDLDNTFWKGIISEGEIQPIQKHIELVKCLSDCGIINSICSKNTMDICVTKLKELSVFDFFVFPSIDWTPKGQRIRELLKNMSLRAENVLFIDDDIVNLEEAKHYSPFLMISDPSITDNLFDFATTLPVSDIKHERLSQYKFLESKHVEQKKFDSNEEFLYASNIQVEICDDCISQIDRIHEVILRTNQLNYTKKRISKEELKSLLMNKSAISGYVTVKDKFGDYGIVGFFAILENKFEHFLFSCRTIGQGIEQYVYASLNYPLLDICGEVITMVTKDPAPPWINQLNSPGNKGEINVKTNNIDIKVLVKGPCDLSKAMTYIKAGETIKCEFTYVNEVKGNIIEAYNHSQFILGLKEFSNQEKQQLINDCIFIDPETFNGTFYKENYDIIFFSTLNEAYGIYKKRNSNLMIAFGDSKYPLTEKENWEKYVNGTVYNANNSFTKEYLKEFSEKYEFIGTTEPDDYINRIKKILNYLDPKTTLCLILGSEIPYLNKSSEISDDRHVFNARLNLAIRKFAVDNFQIKIIDVNDIVKNQSDFTDSINHFTTRIYYEISQKMIHVINAHTHVKVKHYSFIYVYFDIVINSIKKVLKKILQNERDGSFYKSLRSVYWKLIRKKK